MRKVPRPILLVAVILLVAGTTICGPDTCAQEAIPPVDYPRVNLSTGYRVDPTWPEGKSTYSLWWPS